MTLPVLHLEGDSYDQGVQHGRALGEQIQHNLDLYYDRFLREGQLPAGAARERAAMYQPVLEGHPYYRTLVGVATGAGQSVLDMLVLNLRYELLYYQYGVCAVGGADGCTSFAVLPAASSNGHLLLGQNWDWIPGVKGAVLHTREPDGLETLGFTEAGIVGAKLGLNSAALGLVINGLMSTADDWSRPVLPFHVRCYEILRQRQLTDAAAVVTAGVRSCSANFLLAQTPGQALDIEAAPDTVRLLDPQHGRLVHSNHFLNPEMLGILEPPVEPRPHSYSRYSRLDALLEAQSAIGMHDLEIALRDHDNHPDGVCRHAHPDDPPEEWCVTVTSAIMDLNALSLRLSDGPPCEHAYEQSALARSIPVGR